MKLSIKIKMDNAAFDGENWSLEIGRILREFTNDFLFNSDLRKPGDSQNILDINGNVIGEAKIIQ